MQTTAINATTDLLPFISSSFCFGSPHGRKAAQASPTPPHILTEGEHRARQLQAIKSFGA
jgi:hypothetical protein